MSQESTGWPNISTGTAERGYAFTEVREANGWHHLFMVMPRSTEMYGSFVFPSDGHLRIFVGAVAVIPMDDEGTIVDMQPKSEPLSVNAEIGFNLVVRCSFAMCVFTYRDAPANTEEAPPEESLDTGPLGEEDDDDEGGGM